MASSQGTATDTEHESGSKLHYERMPYDAREILKFEGGSCLAVHDKFILLGTRRGAIHILDHQGNCTRTIKHHTTSVSHMSIDDRGEHMASCGENGLVFTHGITSIENRLIFSFRETVHFCVLNPNFENDHKKRFFIGSDKVMYYQKNVFGQYKMSIIFGNEGSVRTCSWKGRFAAFSSDISVVVFDTEESAILCKFKKDLPVHLPADLYTCQFVWMDQRQLLIGWADHINLCHIQRKTKEMRRTESTSTEYYLEITSMFTTEDVFLCGLAPFNTSVAVLGTAKAADGQDNASQVLFIVLEPHGGYCIQRSADRIPLAATLDTRTDYTLHSLPGEQRFFILGPSDLVVARLADLDDYIDKLLCNKAYKEAMEIMTNRKSEVKRHNILNVGQHYLNHLLDTNDFDQVGPLCKKIFGTQASLWEDRVFTLAQKRLCHIIADYLPHGHNKSLSAAAYEIVLNEFVNTRPNKLLTLLRRWKGFYSARTVQLAIEERLKYSPDVRLKKAVGILMIEQKQYEQALLVFLSTGASEEVKMILRGKFDFFKDIIFDRIMEFMEVDYKEAASFFAKHNYYKVNQVIDQLEANQTFFLEYLRCKFFQYPNALEETHHNHLLGYYVNHDRSFLLSFLKKSNKYSLEQALKLCEEKRLLRETAFLHERMGNHERALSIIIEEVKDIEYAIEFCQEQKREDLWNFLVNKYVNNPDYLTVLLKRVGSYIDPTNVISLIPQGLQIPQLRDSLVQIIHDFKLQIILRESCQKIMLANHNTLFKKLYHFRKRAVYVSANTGCEVKRASIIKIYIIHNGRVIILRTLCNIFIRSFDNLSVALQRKNCHLFGVSSFVKLSFKLSLTKAKSSSDFRKLSYTLVRVLYVS